MGVAGAWAEPGFGAESQLDWNSLLLEWLVLSQSRRYSSVSSEISAAASSHAWLLNGGNAAGTTKFKLKPFTPG